MNQSPTYPSTLPTAPRCAPGQPIQLVAEPAPQPLGARVGLADRRTTERSAPCVPVSLSSVREKVLVGATLRAVAHAAARPTVTSRLRLSSSDTVSPPILGSCWRRQPSFPVCRTRRDKGSVEVTDTCTTDMTSTLPARTEPRSRGQVGFARTRTA